jgi:hypothetical protein
MLESDKNRRVATGFSYMEIIGDLGAMWGRSPTGVEGKRVEVVTLVVSRNLLGRKAKIRWH